MLVLTRRMLSDRTERRIMIGDDIVAELTACSSLGVTVRFTLPRDALPSIRFGRHVRAEVFESHGEFVSATVSFPYRSARTVAIGEVSFTVVSMDRNKARIGIAAPRSVNVVREELLGLEEIEEFERRLAC
jgi:sRNA-binding carbon storage regulator CsrA